MTGADEHIKYSYLSKKMDVYEWMRYPDVEKHVIEADQLGVSRVARGVGGFVRAYKKARVPKNMSHEWHKKRENFIKRTLAQYSKNPTHRRKLSLYMWAFNPERRSQ